MTDVSKHVYNELSFKVLIGSVWLDLLHAGVFQEKVLNLANQQRLGKSAWAGGHLISDMNHDVFFFSGQQCNMWNRNHWRQFTDARADSMGEKNQNCIYWSLHREAWCKAKSSVKSACPTDQIPSNMVKSTLRCTPCRWCSFVKFTATVGACEWDEGTVN